ncbi:hypothetical protein [Bradyrhizobium canariense]|jgi:hypothetical protein|uniref:Uncharacterized protein n=1 Tax=Bradyrhizobium canariense TaxID=255045 RepID=A0A1H1Q3E3_9BRAD|nr:hypothetical protein [Bradyrhizobium canariense]SDS17910.1 hypothetical protein SAMN05444158_1253 [Bradyrhizobium canariense]
MTIETIAIPGAVFAAATFAAVTYERRMDVLYGPYIEGRATFSAAQFWQPVHAAADRLGWKARNVIYFASVIAC